MGLQQMFMQRHLIYNLRKYHVNLLIPDVLLVVMDRTLINLKFILKRPRRDESNLSSYFMNESTGNLHQWILCVRS